MAACAGKRRPFGRIVNPRACYITVELRIGIVATVGPREAWAVKQLQEVFCIRIVSQPTERTLAWRVRFS
jgi:hypothetical protein